LGQFIFRRNTFGCFAPSFFFPSQVAKSHHRKKAVLFIDRTSVGWFFLFQRTSGPGFDTWQNLVGFPGVAPSLILSVLASLFKFNNPQACFGNWVGSTTHYTLFEIENV
jgi:hypothetical protein